MRRLAVSLAALATVAIAVSGFAPGPSAATSQADTPSYYSLKLPTGMTIDDLVRDGYDISHGHGSRPTLVATAAEADRLRSRGVVVGKTGNVYQPVIRSSAEIAGTTYYGGYHTSAGHEQHNAAVTAAHPDLVKLYDVGDSWKKTKGQGGHDIQALCITKLTTGDCALNSTGKKPKFVLHAQIHAREVATGEIAYKWIDLLVTSYGTDPAITSLLDSRELWVIPIANPDGVDVVASNSSQPVMQRKNVNPAGGCSAGDAGVDLNRNSSFQWDVQQGGPCDETYPGTKAVSEPETVAIQSLLDKLFRDTKGGVGEPAAADTTGVFLTLHSFGGDILAPYGYTNTAAPNRAALVALGKKMGALNGYPVTTGDAGVGYFAPGATDDWLYGTRGVPSYTFEIGPESGSCGGFFPAYTCLTNTLWPAQKPALLYAARAAATPYGKLP